MWPFVARNCICRQTGLLTEVLIPRRAMRCVPDQLHGRECKLQVHGYAGTLLFTGHRETAPGSDMPLTAFCVQQEIANRDHRSLVLNMKDLQTVRCTVTFIAAPDTQFQPLTEAVCSTVRRTSGSSSTPRATRMHNVYQRSCQKLQTASCPRHPSPPT